MTLDTSKRCETLAELKNVCEKCTSCSLCETRTNLVFGSGSESAGLMFVGEAPGEKEDLSGVPFVGAAGKLLDHYLCAVGIERSDVYIANILKCRPPKNRDPLPSEQEACIGYLREQVRIIKPSVIVCLGRISAMRLIKPDFKITAEHGKFYKRGNFMMSAVFHPAALLRDPRRKEAMFEDMMNLKNYLDTGTVPPELLGE